MKADLDLRHERDAIPGRALAMVVAGGAVAILVAVIVVEMLGGSVPIAGPPPPRERSYVEAHEYRLETDAEQQRRAADAHLRSSGWIDRAHLRIHVPIDVATKLYLDEEAAKP
jgi:hypothetical protein